LLYTYILVTSYKAQIGQFVKLEKKEKHIFRLGMISTKYSFRVIVLLTSDNSIELRSGAKGFFSHLSTVTARLKQWYSGSSIKNGTFSDDQTAAFVIF